jgi:hypothetical protein
MCHADLTFRQDAIVAYLPSSVQKTSMDDLTGLVSTVKLTQFLG